MVFIGKNRKKDNGHSRKVFFFALTQDSRTVVYVVKFSKRRSSVAWIIRERKRG